MLQALDSFFNKGFRGDKCKTLLKLVTSRIKLLRNKRQIHLKQARKELAQLLENGQESTARIRVEHIMREQNIIEAYDILELYCELIIVRIPIIEAQMECPLDLQEAVASLIFAAPRSSDLMELLQVQNMFTIKYGKEFSAAAAELRPGCKVNRNIIEKLSARAPSTEAKINVMKEIAEEHSVEWNAASAELEFTKMPEDLLDGSTQFLNPERPVYFPEQKSVDKTLRFPVTPPKEVESHLPPTGHISLSMLNNHVEDSSLPTLTKAMQKSQIEAEEPKFVPFVRPISKETVATPARFYSPPRESAIAQSSGFLEETLLQRTLSRTKSEGSMNLQDIIEAAETAAESAEKAAQAARAAAELARSRLSPKSSKNSDHNSLNQVISGVVTQLRPSDMNPSYSKPETGSKKHTILLDPESYDWTQQYNGSDLNEQNKSGFDKSTAVDDQPPQTSTLKHSLHLTPESYDWTKQQYKSIEEIEGSTHTRDSDTAKSSIFDTFEDDDYSKESAEFSQAHVKSADWFSESGNYNYNATPESKDFRNVNDQGSKTVFDGTDKQTSPRQVQRLPSLDDDPYYTYPNLFSKP